MITAGSEIVRHFNRASYDLSNVGRVSQEFGHDPPAGSGINAIEPYCQFAVQMPHEITMRHRRVFEAHNDVEVIRKEGPRV